MRPQRCCRQGEWLWDGKRKTYYVEGVPHHLIDFLQPQKEYNVSRYRRKAIRKIKEIIKKGKIPFFVGGTGLYMSVLVNGIFKGKTEDKALRRKLYKLADKFGKLYLYEKLKAVDSPAAAKIHPNDTRRIVRALEVFGATGKPISQLQKTRKGLSSEYDLEMFCLDMPRQQLYQRIDERVDKMFRQGLVKEAKRLLGFDEILRPFGPQDDPSGKCRNKKLPRGQLSKTAACAIGIRELKGYFDGLYNLEEAKRLIKRNTRLYAKRQLTWFRKDKRISWIKIDAQDKPKEITERLWREFF